MYNFEQLGEKYRQELIDLTCDLVKIPTENIPPNGDEKEGQEFFKKYLSEKLGMEIDAFSPADLPDYQTNPEFLHRNHEGRQDVIGIWKGSGGGRSLTLTGHMDVVPKEPMPWVVCEPYQPIIKDGRIYGRGSCDMKGGLAANTIAVKMLKDAGFQPKGDIMIESVVDEEYAGANGTIAARLKGYNADFSIISEAVNLNVCPACVGGFLVKITIQGTAGMPFTGEEIVNPAYDLADLIHIIRAFGEKRDRECVKPALWDKSAQDSQIVITKVKAGEVQESGQLSTPINAWVEIVIQTYPGEKQEDLEVSFRDFVRSKFRDPDLLTIETEYHYCRPTSMDPNHEGVQLLAECTKEFTDQGIVNGSLLSCDMFAFHEIGKVPCVLFGPIGGNFHAPDEWVDIDSLMTVAKSIAKFIVQWCG